MQRSSGVTVLAIVCIVLGALSLIYSTVDLVRVFRERGPSTVEAVGQLVENLTGTDLPVPQSDSSVTGHVIYGSVSCLLSLLLIIGGAGLLGLKQWGRYLVLTVLGLVVVVQIANILFYFVKFRGAPTNTADYFGPLLLSKLSIALNILQWLGAFLLAGLGYWFLLRPSTKEQFLAGVMSITPQPGDQVPDININVGQQIVIPGNSGGSTVNPRSSDRPAGHTGPIAWLVVIKGNGERVRHQVNNTAVRIGRGPDNDIQLADSTVSTEHAKIYFQDERYWVHDLGSRNGTVLNNQAVTKNVLRNNDKLRFGKVECIFMQA